MNGRPAPSTRKHAEKIFGTKLLVSTGRNGAVDDHGRLEDCRNCDQGQSALEDGPTRTAINPNTIQTRGGVDAKNICWPLRFSNGHKFRLLVVVVYPLATLLGVGPPARYHSNTIHRRTKMKESTEGLGDRMHRRSKNCHGRPQSSWIDIAVLALLTWPASVTGSGCDNQGDSLSARWWSRGESRESSRARRLRPTSALTSSLRATNTTSSSTSNVTGGLIGDIRIVGGAPVPDATMFPTYAFTAGTQLCGATFIHPDILLTAAHCGGAFLKGILHGGLAITGEDSSYIKVDKEFPHPEYSNETDANDIMLVKLSAPTSAPLQTLNFDPSFPGDGVSTTVIGFGRTSETGEISNMLQQVDVTTKSHDTCNALFGKLIEEIMLCAGGDGQRDSCQGDSGGPLFAQGDRRNSLVQVGIVSFGSGCARDATPAVYARVSGFEGWIRQGICDLSAEPPDDCIMETSPPMTGPSTGPPTQAPATSRPSQGPSAVAVDKVEPTTSPTSRQATSNSVRSAIPTVDPAMLSSPSLRPTTLSPTLQMTLFPTLPSPFTSVPTNAQQKPDPTFSSPSTGPNAQLMSDGSDNGSSAAASPQPSPLNTPSAQTTVMPSTTPFTSDPTIAPQTSSATALPTLSSSAPSTIVPTTKQPTRQPSFRPTQSLQRIPATLMPSGQRSKTPETMPSSAPPTPETTVGPTTYTIGQPTKTPTSATTIQPTKTPTSATTSTNWPSSMVSSTTSPTATRADSSLPTPTPTTKVLSQVPVPLSSLASPPTKRPTVATTSSPQHQTPLWPTTDSHRTKPSSIGGPTSTTTIPQLPRQVPDLPTAFRYQPSTATTSALTRYFEWAEKHRQSGEPKSTKGRMKGKNKRKAGKGKKSKKGKGTSGLTRVHAQPSVTPVP